MNLRYASKIWSTEYCISMLNKIDSVSERRGEQIMSFEH